MLSKRWIKIGEYSSIEIPDPLKFNDQEIQIIETEFKEKLRIVPKFSGSQELISEQYVGYVVLPNHVIVITPKIPGISLLNMIRYGLRLPELNSEYLDLAKENNYYDVLVLFLLQELEKILQKGLHQGYINYDDNISRVKGKIDFKQHITINYDRKDKVFCSYSEFSPDITENRIIKFTLFYLSHCYFIDDRINSRLLSYYNRLNEVNIVPINNEIFRSIEYSPLNSHYRPILDLCELFLREISIDEEIGDKTSISFLIDMNKLFEVFIGNLLIGWLDGSKYQVDLQRTEYPELTGKTLKVRIDIMISYNNKPILILDTKYQRFLEHPSESHIAQINLYSTSTGVKTCALIYVGQTARRVFYLRNMTLHTMAFDFVANNQLEFNVKCKKFILEVKSLLNTLKNQI